MLVSQRIRNVVTALGTVALLVVAGCADPAAETENITTAGASDASTAEGVATKTSTDANAEKAEPIPSASSNLATFGGGCFWCVEAVFEEMTGVKSVVSGYAAGKTKNPTYAEVCTGTTDHAEVCQIEFDPDVVSYQELLEVFFKTHDPSTPNRQGNDYGTQYRSIILFHDAEQQATAQKYIEKLDASGEWSGPVTTQLEKAGEFYIAEEKHQDYYARNPSAPYCLAVVGSKVKKFRDVFPEKRKQPE